MSDDSTYVYTVDDCLGQIVDHIETVGLEDASNLFIRDCLVRLWKSAAKDDWEPAP